MNSDNLLARTHYPMPVIVTEGEVAWRIMGPVQQSQPGLTSYDLGEAAALCQYLNDQYAAAAAEDEDN